MQILNPGIGFVVFSSGITLLVLAYWFAWYRVRRASLGGVASRPRVRRWMFAGIAVLLLAVAAAQPVVTITKEQEEACAAAEVLVGIDNSLSFVARSSREAPTRYERAVDAVFALRAEHGCAKWGLASFIGDVAPRFMPGGSTERLVIGLDEVIQIGQPTSGSRCTTSGCIGTNLPRVLQQVMAGRFFSEDDAVKSRTFLVFTDGESPSNRIVSVERKMQELDVHVVFIRIGDERDRVYMTDGTLNPHYSPDPNSRATLDTIAARLPNTKVFDESETEALSAHLRSIIGDPTEQSTLVTTERPLYLAPWVALAALGMLVLLFFELGGVLGRAVRLGRK